jgi:hypothetical protein
MRSKNSSAPAVNRFLGDGVEMLFEQTAHRKEKPMLKPFNDHYTVTELKKVNRGTLKAVVTFRSTNRRRKGVSRLELHVDKLAVWLEVPAEEDPINPDTVLRFADQSETQRVRLASNYVLKQMALRTAVSRYLDLPDDPFGWDLRDFLNSRAWKSWRPQVTTATLDLQPKASKKGKG